MARPTICGLGGNLDAADHATSETRAAFDLAVANFTPTGCDAVAVYPYSVADATDTDWTMRDLLPYMLDRLRGLGWDPARQPLVGIPQAFRARGALSPAAIDVATQTAAYCAAGASAIAFYAWDEASGSTTFELYDAPDLRQGATNGLARCKAFWGGGDAPRTSRYWLAR